MSEERRGRTRHASALIPRRTFLKGAAAGAVTLGGIPGILAAGRAPAFAATVGKPVELRYYDWKLADKPARKALETITAEFEKKYPHIKVKLEEVAWPDHQKKLVMLAQGGSPPDVARITDAGLLPLADIGALSPLTDWAVKNKVDDFLTKIPQSVRKALQFKGADYIANPTASMDVLTWNRDLFKAAGLDPEKDVKFHPLGDESMRFQGLVVGQIQAAM